MYTGSDLRRVIPYVQFMVLMLLVLVVCSRGYRLGRERVSMPKSLVFLTCLRCPKASVLVTPSLPFIGTREGREQAATGVEAMEGDKAKRQWPKRRAVRIQCPL